MAMANPNTMKNQNETRTLGSQPGERQGQGDPPQQDLMHKTKDAAAAVGEKANAAASAVGEGMTSLAHSLREKAPQTGMLGTASSRVASGLESGGRYLQQEGFEGMMNDLTHLIRSNPIPALLVGVGVGFLLAQIRRR
jgi:hypothetical protein